MAEQPTQATAPRIADAPETTALLLATFADLYRQEVGAEEDVHRALPLRAQSAPLPLPRPRRIAFGTKLDMGAGSDHCHIHGGQTGLFPKGGVMNQPKPALAVSPSWRAAEGQAAMKPLRQSLPRSKPHGTVTYTQPNGADVFPGVKWFRTLLKSFRRA